MKLADALTLRKQLMPVAENVQTKSHNAPALIKTPVYVAPGHAVSNALVGIRQLSAMGLIDRCVKMSSGLEALDNIIQATNQSLHASLPVYLFQDCMSDFRAEDRALSTRSMCSMLTRRKTLKAYVGVLSDYAGGAMQGSPQVSRVNQPSGRQPSNPDAQEEWTVVTNNFNATELALHLNFFSRCLREVDSAIQSLNWSTEVNVPDWISPIYIPSPPQYYVPPAAEAAA